MSLPAIALNATPLDAAQANDNEPAMEWEGIAFSEAEINEPGSWSEEKQKQVVDKLCENLYYSEYSDYQRSPYDLKTTHKMAAVILEAKQNGEHVIGALEESGLFGDSDGSYDELYNDADKAVTRLLNEIEEAREELELTGDYDENELQEQLRDAAIEQTQEKDDSSITDLIGSYDKFEIAFNFSPCDSIEDHCIATAGVHCDYNSLQVNDGLVGALGRMGISLKEYREHSGNKEKSCLETAPGRKMKHKVWETPAVTLDQVKELVENACSSHFIFMAYAQVSLTDFIALDINQPMVLSQYSIASYNGWQGTFHDVSIGAPLVINPEQAHILLPGRFYSPDSICCLDGRYYEAKLSN